MFLLVASLISVFIAVLIISYNASNLLLPANVYLSLFFLIFGIYGIAQYVIQFSASITLVTIFFNHFTPLYACFGPLLYLYVKKVINDDHVYLRKEELIHMLPFTIALIDLSPYLVSSFESKILIVKELAENAINYKMVKHLFLSDINATIVRQFVNLMYIIYSLIYVFKTNFSNISSLNQNRIVTRWMKVLLLIMTMFLFFVLIETFFNRLLNFSILNTKLKILLIFISWLFRFLLVIAIFFFPSILYGMPDNNLIEYSIDTLIQDTETKLELQKKEYKAFTLERSYLLYIDQLVQSYMINSPYLNDKFGLSTLTVATKIPLHHLHIYFKEYLKTNFNTWKNEHKVNYSKQLIENNMLSNLTTEAIAVNSGFKSYSNYFTVFKSQTGMTPTEYASSLKK